MRVSLWSDHKVTRTLCGASSDPTSPKFMGQDSDHITGQSPHRERGTRAGGLLKMSKHCEPSGRQVLDTRGGEASTIPLHSWRTPLAKQRLLPVPTGSHLQGAGTA